MRLLIDVENTFSILNDKVDPSPYHPDNRLVSVGILDLDTDKILYGFVDDAEFVEKAKKLLPKATMYVGHNIRHDVEWLLECGFPLNMDARLWCTILSEYILARGIKCPLSLAALAEKYDLPRKKDILKEYIAQGLNVDQVPRDELQEYGEGDLITGAALFEHHEKLYALDENSGLVPTLKLSQDMTWAVIDMERNGLAIDLKALQEVRDEFTKEFDDLTKKIQDMIFICGGSRQINLNSEEQLSEVIYSRRVLDKKKWAATFNIGLNERGKPLRRPQLTRKRFYDLISANTQVLSKTEKKACESCGGSGFIQKIKVDGTEFKRRSTCKSCMGAGYIDIPILRSDGHSRRVLERLTHYASGETKVSYERAASRRVFGLCCRPLDDVYEACTGGLSTSKDTLGKLVTEALNEQDYFAAEFLGAVIRRNALKTYITSFVDGISTYTRRSGLLHCKINQSITATGRLSSSDPNLQNQPRGGTFPIRRTFISRFPGGRLLECDFRQLEFRIAGELSKDPNIFADIYNKVDVHSKTSRILTEAGQRTDRQGAKPHTFKPLYGGLSGTAAEQTYYREFLEHYSQLAKFHDDLQNQAITLKKIILPTGREYAFPSAKRLAHGGSSFATQIKNYPVQGFATADIVPLATVRLRRFFRMFNVQSLIVNEIHDSILVDVFPGEEDLTQYLITCAMVGLHAEILERYNYAMEVELEIEGKIGYNALNMEFLFDASSKQFEAGGRQSEPSAAEFRNLYPHRAA